MNRLNTNKTGSIKTDFLVLRQHDDFLYSQIINQIFVLELTPMQQVALLDLLNTFSQTWNAHDVEQLMACMHPDCCFETVAGDEVYGTRIQGIDAVRQVFGQTFETFPDAQWRNAKHWISADGESGISETTFTATTAENGRIEANMVDVFQFKDGKILLKNAFRKNRPVQTAA